jgi:hypothetical protein
LPAVGSPRCTGDAAIVTKVDPQSRIRHQRAA